MKNNLLKWILMLFPVLFGVKAFGQKEKALLYDDWPYTIHANKDILNKRANHPNYVPFGSVWNKRILTYFFSNGTDDMSGSTEHDAVRQGFTYWANATAIRFIEVCNISDADIVILWSTGYHGHPESFDGTGGIMAHAAAPPPGGGIYAGDIHFDDDETWVGTTRGDNSQPIDLVTVAAHEIGHSLGLDHTGVSGSLMLSTYTGSHRYLGSDDIDGITSLYSPSHEFLSGLSVVCSSATYSVVDLPASTTSVSFSSSNSSILTINSSTGVASRVGYAEGQVTITANIGNGCGNLQLTKTIWVGKPDLTKKLNGDIIDISSAPVAPGSMNVLETITGSPSGSTTFNKTDHSGTGDIYIIIHNPTMITSSVEVSNSSTSGYRQVKMFATNACGTTEDEIFLYLMSFFKAVYPNPAKDYLTIEFNNLTDKATLPDAIELYQEESMKRE